METGTVRPPLAPPPMDASMRTHLPDWTSRWQSPMLGFARLHLSSGEDAEDVVQRRGWPPAARLAARTAAGSRPTCLASPQAKVVDRLCRRYAENERQVQLADDLDELLFDVWPLAGRHGRAGLEPASTNSCRSPFFSHWWMPACSDCQPRRPRCSA